MVVYHPLPTRLDYAWNHPVVGQFAETNPADTELSVHRTWPTANTASVPKSCRKLRLLTELCNFWFTRHRPLSWKTVCLTHV